MRIRRHKSSEGGMHYIKGAKVPGILIIAVIVLAVVLGVKIGSDWQQALTNKKNHKTEITSDTLHKEIEQIGELATVDYFYTNMGKFEDAVQFLDHNVPFTTKSFILSYDGQIKAGINLEEVQIHIADYAITVTIPQAKILSHDVDMDSVVLYDEKNSIFNGLSAEDVTVFIGKQQKTMEEKAIYNGLLERAQTTALQVLQNFLTKFVETNENGDKQYKLNFVTAELGEVNTQGK